MSYYFNDKNNDKIYSDNPEIGTEFKKIYYFKSNFIDNGSGLNFALNNFYIKDGSRPYFIPKIHWNDDISSLEMTGYEKNYMPIFQVALSSISGKYGLIDNNYNYSYYIPEDIIPEIYNLDLLKFNNNSSKTVISDVDYSKGEKLSWRITEENLKYFTNGIRGPNTANYDPINSGFNLNVNFRNENFLNRAFIYKNKEDTIPITPFDGLFIKSKPKKISNNNLFGLKIHDEFSGDYTPPHFTLKTSALKNAGTKLKVKIDGIYLNANTDFGATATTSLSVDRSIVENSNSFSSTNQIGITEYCQGLFYATNNDEQLVQNDIIQSADYLGNGVYFSNLTSQKVNSNYKLMVDKPSEYNVTYTAINDYITPEIQDFNNNSLWDNMALVFVMDNKCYTSEENNEKMYEIKFHGEINNEDVKFSGYIEQKFLLGGGSILGLEDLQDYEYVPWNNYSPTIPQGKKGIYTYKSTNENTFTNYRNLIYGNDSVSINSGFLKDAIHKTDLANLSSNWLVYINYDYLKNEPNYYKQGIVFNNKLTSHLGILDTNQVVYQNSSCDMIWKSNGYNTDPFGNTVPDISERLPFISTGMSPTAGTNYTIVNESLVHEIDLDEISGDYLHICYPYTTLPLNHNNANLIPQITISYELV